MFCSTYIFVVHIPTYLNMHLFTLKKTYITVTLIESKGYFKTSPYSKVKTASYDSNKMFGCRNAHIRLALIACLPSVTNQKGPSRCVGSNRGPF